MTTRRHRAIETYHPDDDTIPNGPAVRVYQPSHPPQDAPLPLILFIHGGGWFAGTLDTEDRSCRMIAALARAVVVSVEYRCGMAVALADEVADCVAGFDWACAQAGRLGADPQKVVVMGGSAGGALAIATVARVRRRGVAGLVHVNGIALHPGATPQAYRHLMTSYVENAGPLPFVSGDDTFALYEHWNITPANIDLDIFPAAGGPDRLKGFPPTFIVTSGNDASRDDGTVLEAMLKDADVRAMRKNFPGLAHFFWFLDLPKANERFWWFLVGGIHWTLTGDEWLGHTA